MYKKISYFLIIFIFTSFSILPLSFATDNIINIDNTNQMKIVNTASIADTLDSVYVWSNTTNSIQNTAVSANPVDLKLESASAILIEQSTGKVLYEHNSHEILRPASVTKVMSILLIMEALDSGQISLTDKVPCSEHASNMGGSQIWLDVTENLSVDEMLKAICVASANDYDVQ